MRESTQDLSKRRTGKGLDHEREYTGFREKEGQGKD